MAGDPPWHFDWVRDKNIFERKVCFEIRTLTHTLSHSLTHSHTLSHSLTHLHTHTSSSSSLTHHIFPKHVHWPHQRRNRVPPKVRWSVFGPRKDKPLSSLPPHFLYPHPPLSFPSTLLSLPPSLPPPLSLPPLQMQFTIHRPLLWVCGGVGLCLDSHGLLRWWGGVRIAQIFSTFGNSGSWGRGGGSVLKESVTVEGDREKRKKEESRGQWAWECSDKRK